MMIKTQAELKNHIKSARFKNVYFLNVKDTYLGLRIKNSLVHQICNDNKNAFNFREFNWNDTSLQEIYDAVESFSLTGSHKTVVVNDIETNSINDNEVDSLCKILEDVPENTTLIAIIDAKNSGKSIAKNTRLAKSADVGGVYVELKALVRSDIVKFIMAEAKRENCRITNINASHLLDMCGDDFGKLSMEIKKLGTCANLESDGEITQSMIDELCVNTTEIYAFELTKQLLNRDHKKSLEILSRLKYQRTDPIIILATIINTYVDIYRIKIAKNCGLNTEAVANDFEEYRKSKTRLSKGNEGIPLCNIGRLRKIMCSLMEADTALKSTGIDGYLLLDMLVKEIVMG